MRVFLILALAACPLFAANEGEVPEPKGEPEAEAPKTITRTDLERRISALQKESDGFQKTIDEKITDYNTETETLRTDASELEQRGYSTNPPDQVALEEAHQKTTEADTRQQEREAETAPDVTHEKSQINERKQKITKLRAEVDKMAKKDPQQPQLPMPDLTPPGEDGDGDSDGKTPLPGEDLLMNDQRLDSQGLPTDMTSEEMKAHYDQAGVVNGPGVAGMGKRGGRYLDQRNKIAAGQMPNFSGARRGDGSLGSGRPGSIRRGGASKVSDKARTGWIPGGRFARGGAGAPIGAGGASGGSNTGSSSWSKYGKGKKFRPPGGRKGKLQGGGNGIAGGKGRTSGSVKAPMSLADRLLKSMSDFKNKLFGGDSSGVEGGGSVDPSWAKGAYNDESGMSPGRSLTGNGDYDAEEASQKGLPAYARSGNALDAEGKNWMDQWPYILAVLFAIIGVLIWKLDLH